MEGRMGEGGRTFLGGCGEVGEWVIGARGAWALD